MPLSAVGVGLFCAAKLASVAQAIPFEDTSPAVTLTNSTSTSLLNFIRNTSTSAPPATDATREGLASSTDVPCCPDGGGGDTTESRGGGGGGHGSGGHGSGSGSSGGDSGSGSSSGSGGHAEGEGNGGSSGTTGTTGGRGGGGGTTGGVHHSGGVRRQPPVSAMGLAVLLGAAVV